MATDSLGVDQVQKENQALKKQVSGLKAELENLKEEVKSCHKKLKKLEYEKENAEGHVINSKRDLDALRKELYDERKKWKQEKEELSKACSYVGQRESISTESAQELSNSSNSYLNPCENDSKDIKAVLEEAATQAMSKSGFVYDDRTGLYYDWNCGLYYDPNSCLYYNNQTGTYYFYDEASKSYKFHSQVELHPEENKIEQNNDQYDKPPKRKKKKKPMKRRIIKVKSSSDEECSSGEIISTDEDDDDDRDLEEGDDDDDDDDANEEQVHKVAPCIRAIVTESDKLKIGTLFIITCTGGTLGREKDVGHGIRIPDVSISKYHCRISYDQERRQYFITDLGSKNGSFLNGQRLGQGNEESEPHVFSHGDVLKVGGTSLAIHIHQGNETCDDCEPGLVQANLSTAVNNEEVYESNTTSQRNLNSEDKRKKLLRNLKKAYGLEKEAYEEDIDIPNKRKYRDRADLRRIKVGSDVPVELPDAPPASVHRPISSENKGRKMLEKMGWKAGEGLGKEGSGLKEPVTAGIHEKSRGLGSGTLRSIDSVNFSPSVSSVMRSKARQRYQKTQTSDAQIVTYKETVFVPPTTKPP